MRQYGSTAWLECNLLKQATPVEELVFIFEKANFFTASELFSNAAWKVAEVDGFRYADRQTADIRRLAAPRPNARVQRSTARLCHRAWN